jgi:threonine/homoserine/homoserine lactone efflux protein
MTEIFQYLPDILLAFSAYLVATISPGPATMAIMGTSMGRGRQSGLSLAMGVTVSSFTWSVIAAFGLTAILTAFGWAFLAIKIAGGLYLLWLAFKSFRSALKRTEGATTPDSGPAKSPKTYFLQGFILHMTNPKAVFAWLAIISIGVQPGAPFWVIAAIIGGCTLLGIGVFGLYALAFSSAPMIRLYQSFRRWIEGVMAALFGFAGVKLLTTSS